MTSLLSGRPESHLSVDGWVVDAMAGDAGLAGISRSGHDLHIRIGDRHPRGDGTSAAAARHLRSVLVADLFPDGTVQLVTRCSPPALLVSVHGAVLLPGDGSVSGGGVLAPDDLLVMCSASTLEAHPAGVVDLLKAGSDVVRRDTERLVQDLVRGRRGGAAAVVRRLPVGDGVLRS